ncbi:sigma-70 family RNA polymerase sigma factor [Mycoplasma feriruminatoris]|uniref:Sigma-70 family RNA polymerase sigma factor n=1 Tax=Mycoplasma feriruminatoris TaxID=1179777 RepID=A0AAQ3DPG4_9MOLU|nr:hypothetical protein [Mycoplasma feriruminatoris]UKS54388.1 hypothetical protein D500_00745 [Mycoplasma feriruminatoris]WFQ90443.1 hypothetical protein MFERI11561_00698 [Mycoplasma feriruminatoris]WFQ91266.1 sigma-70 family RNA polymerase sigma factor [Mycoplasma feriruminatoris]WFQ92086.1 hypothetical protein MFERI14815_00703 [Mycoplasma feriruminatoris]WFQ93776.1 sigma-70 family RNA polymerase sigma factor [Mycoplasma feriruminatoris]
MKKSYEKSLDNLNLEEKTELFATLTDILDFNIRKMMIKFYSVPLRHQDLLSYAWMVFDDLLKVYKSKEFNLKLLLKINNAINLKCIEICTKSIKNQYQDFNISFTTCNLNKNNKLETTNDNQLQKLIDSYFINCKDELAKSVFEMYLNNLSTKEICNKLKISRNKFIKILNKIICDLQNVVTSALV